MVAPLDVGSEDSLDRLLDLFGDGRPRLDDTGEVRGNLGRIVYGWIYSWFIMRNCQLA